MRLIPIIILILALISCAGSNSNSDGGNDSDGGNVNPMLQVLASNVILGSANAANISAKSIDTTTQVLAENVVLDTAANNNLDSDNLQDALDNEIAVDLATTLIGTWTIQNKTTDTNYEGTTGQLTISSNGTFSLDSGHFAAAGICGPVGSVTDCNCPPTSNPTYEILSNSVIYVTFSSSCGGGLSFSSVISVISAKTNTIVVVGDGGYTSDDQKITRASVLTKVE